MKHTNLSIFIPHMGCPFCCSFCNQGIISGKTKAPTDRELITLLNQQQEILKRNNVCAEIAFFGGSFTAIDRNYMIKLLSAAKSFCDKFPEQYTGLRCSTIPDFIDEEILGILKEYGMRSIELGAQSMNNDVLEKNNRGHTASDVKVASKMIRDFGFSLGLQMMTGLYGSTIESDLDTAKQFIELKPDTVRIYPTVVLKHTRLAEYFNKGIYKPFSFDESVELCSNLLKMFEKNNVKVIRLGLHASDDIKNDFIAGTYHPAFREICESRNILNKIIEQLNILKGNTFNIYTNSRNLSKVIGHKKSNLNTLEKKGYKIKIFSDDFCKGEFKIVKTGVS